jgi:Uma2 family endonuclease
VWTQDDYEQAARAYQASLTLEDIMETTHQSIQRKITLESFDLLRERLPHFHFFSELAVQYLIEGELCRVVPDCMVILGDLPIHHRSCYQPQQELPLFWTLEFVSRSNWERDYKTKRECYERELKVPWYLMYDPEEQPPFRLTLYRHAGDAGYQLVSPNAAGRLEIPPLELEVGLVGEWARFWYRGELLGLPAEVEQERDQARQDADRLKKELDRQHAANEALVACLRPLVEERARRAGRQDILAALPATADPDTFRRWLEELA